MSKYPTKTLGVTKNLDSGYYAVTMKTDTGIHTKGKLNFDQVVALLESVFVFGDESELVGPSATSASKQSGEWL